VYLLVSSALTAFSQTESGGMIYRQLGRTGTSFGNRTQTPGSKRLAALPGRSACNSRMWGGLFSVEPKSQSSIRPICHFCELKTGLPPLDTQPPHLGNQCRSRQT